MIVYIYASDGQIITQKPVRTGRR